MQFTATGTASDGKTYELTPYVSWTSSDLAVATLSNAAPTNGIATSVGIGTTAVTAAWGGMVSTSSLTVASATHNIHGDNACRLRQPSGCTTADDGGSHIYRQRRQFMAAGPDHTGHLEFFRKVYSSDQQRSRILEDWLLLSRSVQSR